jgi:hypothetical protein
LAIHTALTRTYARAPRGQRAVVTEPTEYGASISVISALALRGSLAPLTIEGAVNTEVFDLYVEHCLAPVLHPGDIVVLDNGRVHSRERAVSLIKGAKAHVEYLPAYSPDQCANIPAGVFFCDHIVEQLPPTITWGKSFVTMPLATRLNGDTFRFLASTDDTEVSVNGVPVATLNRGQLHERIINGPAQITSSQPILVAQYSNSSTFDGVTSDPFMILIPPFEQFLGNYTVTTPATGFDTNFINIVTPNSAVGAITLDGVPIPGASFVAIGSSGFSGTQVPVDLGSHNLAGPLPFGAFVYGFASFDSYGYPGGMSLAPVVAVTEIALSPKTATSPVNTEHCVTAAVTDQNNSPVEGVRVDFDASEANPTSDFANTDVVGEATFCYIGTNAGTDSIVASVGSIFDTASKTWTDAGVLECPLSQGFWKTHPSDWPVNQLTLGSQSYSQAELLALLKAPVGSGKNADASLILATQLIATKLNIADGADASPISGITIDADTLLSSYANKLPYKVKPSSATGQAMTTDAAILRDYNEGVLTPTCTAE